MALRTQSSTQPGRTHSRENSWYVYILRCADTTFYTGITMSVADRVQAHNAGLGARYTRGRGPVELVYVETFGSRGEALRREAEIKRLPRKSKCRLAEQRLGGKLARARCAGRDDAAATIQPRSDAEHPERG